MRRPPLPMAGAVFFVHCLLSLYKTDVFDYNKPILTNRKEKLV